ncbi:rhomboid family intramembrane serine protease [Phaeobacter marinintestinus]|uniref:rhomboid family intramembrane serine protease n=1 Tax=Falsiphaeobacter marinintestinus TaxID=1492905 RepID=UPI0011B7083F|nr:rhomboid family intramembrane serine protease [Phaeobacter marinintestinus]
MSSDPNIPAVNPLPPVVAALFLVIMGIEVTFFLGTRGLIGGPEAVGWRLDAINRYAFSSEIFAWMRQNNVWPTEHLIRFVSYSFVHVSFTQALFAGVFVLAMGKMVAEAFGSIAMLLVFVVSGIGGALVYGLVLPDATWLIGGFPAVYGLIGAFTFLLWRSLATVGANQTRAFSLIAMLMGIQLLFGLLFGGNNDWVADLAGFATGFGLSFFLVPGGWAAIRNLIRRD